jgi:hypothetical protein
MKRNILILLALSLMTAINGLNAQDCELFDGFKEGSKMKMVNYDEKDRMTGFTITEVKEKTNGPDGVSVSFHQVYDNTEDYTFESDFVMKCKDGVTFVDMKSFIDPTSLEAYKDMEIQVDGDNLSIPAGAKAGDQLDGGTITININTGTPIKVNMSVEISDRMVESIENIETPAGTFKCLKIKYNMLSKVGFIKIQSSVVEYFNKRDGVIRSESYNKKGKLQGYSVIEEITN